VDVERNELDVERRGYLNAVRFTLVRRARDRLERKNSTRVGRDDGRLSTTTLMRWTGSGWQSVGGTILGEVWSLFADSPASGPGVVYVCGPAFGFGSVTTYGLAVWNGTQYSALGGAPIPYPSAPQRLAIYDEGSGPRLFTGGLPSMDVTPDARGIARWDGSSWSAVGTSNGYDVSGGLVELAVVREAGGRTLYAAGSLQDGQSGTLHGTGVGRWTGAIS
jgi:hypothetical protein